MSKEDVSIIIAARNEEKNLPILLDALKNQKYPNFEIIIVNDGSTDKTEEILNLAQSSTANIVVLHQAPEGKKSAISRGILKAKNDLLLFIDADCIPSSDYWIYEITAACTGKKEIVLGYGAYKKKNGLLNKLIRFDTVQIAIQYLSMALWNHPYMGVGRNLCYRKSLFQKTGGFESHQHIRSGDDDLFIQEAAHGGNTEISIHPDSFTISEPASTFFSWIRQKLRHHTTATKYRKGLTLLLLISGLAPAFYYLTLLILLFSENYLYGIITYSFILLYQLFTFKPAVNKLGENDLIIFWPILDIIHTFVLFYIGLYSLIYSRTRWN
jgi:glycosyltransferase involved in cell wall biosynthesis